MKIKNNTEKGYLEAEEGDGINISGRMAQQRGNVQKGMCQTINTMGTDGGVAVYDERSERERESSCLMKPTPKEILFYIMGLCGIIEKKEFSNYEERLHPLLCLLWQEIGKKEIWEQIRRFWSIQTKEVLRPNLYVKSIFESWEEQPNLENSPSNSKEYNEISITNESVFYLWEKWKIRYTPQRWQLQEQQFRQFNVCMSQLPHQDTQEERSLCDLWETYEGFGVLRETLSKIQEIWRSTLPQEQSCLRIRKLTPLECLKLQGFDENDYKALKEIQSDSAIYHEAGDSLGVPLFALLVNQMLETDKRQKVLDYIDTLKGDYDDL